MNNEPVAWMDSLGNLTKQNLGDFIPLYTHPVNPYQSITDTKIEPTIVSYTHPVKEQDCYGDGNVYRGVRSKDSEIQTIYFNPVKELTDEEVLQQAEWIFGTHFFECIDDPYWIEFARAILRKAQQ